MDFNPFYSLHLLLLTFVPLTLYSSLLLLIPTNYIVKNRIFPTCEKTSSSSSSFFIFTNIRTTFKINRHLMDYATKNTRLNGRKLE